jgi:hypothetical protein
MDKFIFLDFDGVLNTERYQVQLRAEGKPGMDGYGHIFDPSAVENLKMILDTVPDARIVVESSWKLEGLDRLRRMWKERKLPRVLFGATPDLFHEDLLEMNLSDPMSFSMMEAMGKGGEIRTWLKKNADTECRYVILDDIPEFTGELAEHHILIDPWPGITEQDAIAAIELLSRV